MKFNENYFDEEDKGYYKYVFNATERQNFSNEDVRQTTEIYLGLLKEAYLYDPQKVVKNGDLLYKAIDKYLTMKEKQEENYHASFENEYYDESYRERTKADTYAHKMNGYGYNDSYDDVEYDESNNGPRR